MVLVTEFLLLFFFFFFFFFFHILSFCKTVHVRTFCFSDHLTRDTSHREESGGAGAPGRCADRLLLCAQFEAPLGAGGGLRPLGAGEGP